VIVAFRWFPSIVRARARAAFSSQDLPNYFGLEGAELPDPKHPPQDALDLALVEER
jgi:hypothetical protein